MTNVRVAAQAILDHAQPANYAADYVMVHRSMIGALRDALAVPEPRDEPPDYRVQCACGWQGTVRQLRDVLGAKGEAKVCPDCSKEFRHVPENCQERAMQALADQAQALDMGYGMPFTHWSKDPLVPYNGCDCSSCADARQPVDVSASDSTVPNRTPPL